MILFAYFFKRSSEMNWNSKSNMAMGASQWRIYYHGMWGQLSTTCSNVLKQPNGELLVAVNHNQLRTMASETADPIDWSYPHPHGQYPMSASCIVYKSLQSQRESNVQPQHARQPPCLCSHSGYKNTESSKHWTLTQLYDMHELIYYGFGPT